MHLVEHDTRLTVQLGAFIEGVFAFTGKAKKQYIGAETPLRKDHLRVINPACPLNNTAVNTDQARCDRRQMEGITPIIS